jgi:hypothetical protein
MSIIIAGVFADHVLIATDTFCVNQNGPYGFVSKAWPITHLPAVVTGRGTSGLITELATQAGVAGLDFDAARRHDEGAMGAKPLSEVVP